MVSIVLKNNTDNLRIMTDANGVAGLAGIAVPGKKHGGGLSEPIPLNKFKACKKDILRSTKNNFTTLLACFGEEQRRVSYEEAETLLQPAPQEKPPGFGAPPGERLAG